MTAAGFELDTSPQVVNNINMWRRSGIQLSFLKIEAISLDRLITLIMQETAYTMIERVERRTKDIYYDFSEQMRKDNTVRRASKHNRKKD